MVNMSHNISHGGIVLLIVITEERSVEIDHDDATYLIHRYT